MFQLPGCSTQISEEPFFSQWSKKGSALPAIATLIHVISDERVKG